MENSAKGTSKPSGHAGQQYSGNNEKPPSDKKISNNKKPSNNEYDNNKKPTNNAHQHNSKPTNSGSSATGAELQVPWHYQSYSTDDGDMFPVQIIDNDLDLNGLGYEDRPKIDVRKA